MSGLPRTVSRSVGETSGGNEYCARARRAEKERAPERKSDGRVRRALESMRMSGGSEKRTIVRNRERGKLRRGGRERQGRDSRREVRERESNGERGNTSARGGRGERHEREEADDAMVRAFRATEGAAPRASDEDDERAKRRRRGTDYLAKGHEGPQVRSMRGGRGNGRSCPDNPSPSLFLTSTNPLAAFSLAPRLARSPPRSFLLPLPLRPPSPPSHPSFFSFSFTRSFTLGSARFARSSPLRGRIADHGRARTTQGPAGTLLTRAGVLSIWVIANANKDNTPVHDATV